jgi:Mce-associated membrane protein
MTTTGKSATSNGHRPADDLTKTEDGVDAEEVQNSEPDESPNTAQDPTGETAEESPDVPAVDEEKPNRAGLAKRVFAGLLVVAVLGGIGYGGWLFYAQHRLDTASRDALQAAQVYAVVLTSIDTNAIDQNFTEVLDGSTGEFHDMYSKSSDQLRQLLLDNKAAAHGTVLESAVQSATPDQVVVLLFVDQSITNTSVPDPRIDRSRIKMTMDNVDGRWLASKVELP